MLGREPELRDRLNMNGILLVFKVVKIVANLSSCFPCEDSELCAVCL